MKKKMNFKFVSSDLASVDVTCAEAQNTFNQPIRCESNTSLGQTRLLPQAVKLA